ncbi:DUF6302 family protein [Streptomyces filipinensis]|uniref:DUF6302 family protein n=1 Tax=Streptomyces filipinensis TaxID=66887 RepID=UPI0036EBF0E0
MTPALQQALRGIDVLPPGEAYDYDYFRVRLGDDQLLACSVAVRVYRMPFLAVPIGRTRRGGFFPLQDLACAQAVLDALKAFNGFPALRTAWVDSPIASHAVEWGDRPPLRWDDEAQRLAFYGLTRPAHIPCTPSSPVTCCSPTAP